MSDKRVRVAPDRYVSWKEGDRHAPMAVRKRNQVDKEKKVMQKAYQKEYREREDNKTAQRAYQKEYRENKKKEKAMVEKVDKEKVLQVEEKKNQKKKTMKT